LSRSVGEVAVELFLKDYRFCYFREEVTSGD
jgi:hypothetical protein